MNAETYTGQKKYTEAISYASKVIAGGYSLKPKYGELFMADNNQNNPETILAINYDGQRNKSYGGLTFLINASFIVTREDIPKINFQEYFGMGGLGGWYGNRSRKELPARFDEKDARRLFFGKQPSVNNVNEFTEGLAVAKFRNVTSSGSYGSNYAEAFADTDFPCSVWLKCIWCMPKPFCVEVRAVIRVLLSPISINCGKEPSVILQPMSRTLL